MQALDELAILAEVPTSDGQQNVEARDEGVRGRGLPARSPRFGQVARELP